MSGKRYSETRHPGEFGGKIYGKKLLPSTKRITGVVRFWDSVQGYGFIKVKGHKDVYVPASALLKLFHPLIAGDVVEFEVDAEYAASKVIFKVQKGKKGIK